MGRISVSTSLTLIAFALITAVMAVTVEAHADGGQIVDTATKTKFDEITRAEGHTFKCLGAGVRKLLMVKVYAVAFCVEATLADGLVKSYVEDHYTGLQGDALFEALRKDPKFFRMLAGAKASRLVVLKMRRDLSKKQLADNMRRSLSGLLSDEKLAELTAAITTGAKKGQVVRIYAVGTKLTVDVAGAVRVIDDEEVTQKLFFVWLGSKSVSPALREDIARRAARLPR
jgi:hypothetical protein